MLKNTKNDKNISFINPYNGIFIKKYSSSMYLVNVLKTKKYILHPFHDSSNPLNFLYEQIILILDDTTLLMMENIFLDEIVVVVYLDILFIR